jgi:hypothetical protein
LKAKGREEARGIARLGSAIALLSAVLLSCLVLISPEASAAPTYVHGPIADTHWTVEESPFIVIEDAFLEPGQVLVIDPGVHVLLHEGSSLYIEGHLFADGSEGESIVFTSNATVKHPGDWGSLILTSHDNVIANARIEYGHRGLLLLEEAAVSLDSVLFIDNQFAGIYSVGSSFEMRDSAIMETGEWGVYLERSEAIMKSCSLIGNGISLFANSTSSAYIVNSSISGTFIDIVVIEYSYARLINTTFDEAKVSIEDELSSVIIQWFVTVEIRDMFSTHVPESEVVISNEEGFNGTYWTDEHGLVRNAIVTEAILMQFETMNLNPYLITARKGEQEVEVFRTIIENTWVELLFSTDLTKPTANAGENMDVDEDEMSTMSASGSTDNDPDFQELGDFFWEFNDQGSSVKLEGLEVDYVFETPGTYWITLTVRDPSGNSDTDTV